MGDSLGRGTAASEVMDYFGLESAEKAVMFGMVTEETWKTVKRGLQKRFRIDVPGMGITFLVPLSSIGGRRDQVSHRASGFCEGGRDIEGYQP